MKFARMFICSVLVVILSLIAGQNASAAEEKFKIKQNDKELFTFRVYEDYWKADSPNITLKVKEKSTKFELTIGSSEYTLKEKDPGVYKIYNPDESLLFKVKSYDERWKVSRSEDDPEPWEITLKDDKLRYKIERLEKELGQIKFYPEDGKMKVKDTSNEEVCSMKSDRLRTAPSVCLFEELSEEHRLILFTLFMLID